MNVYKSYAPDIHLTASILYMISYSTESFWWRCCAYKNKIDRVLY